LDSKTSFPSASRLLYWNDGEEPVFAMPTNDWPHASAVTPKREALERTRVGQVRAQGGREPESARRGHAIAEVHVAQPVAANEDA
jgi:hypothetical protein